MPIAPKPEVVSGSIPVVSGSATGENPFSAATIAAKQDQNLPHRKPEPKRKNGLPLSLPILSGILALILIVGGAAFYLKLLPGQPGSSKVSPSQSISTATAAASTSTAYATVTTPANLQTSLPKPSIPVGTLLYGATLPSCSTSNNGWSSNTYARVTCNTSDVRVANTGGQAGGVFLKNLPGGSPIPNNYTIEVQIKEVTAGKGAFGIFFHTQSSTGHHGGLSLLIQSSGYWKGYTYDDTTGQSNLVFGRQGTALNVNGFTTIDITVHDGDFTIYYNGVSQGDFVTSTYTGGYLGLAVDQGTTVAFKNLAIYTP
jgi:hypothetical protein